MQFTAVLGVACTIPSIFLLSLWINSPSLCPALPLAMKETCTHDSSCNFQLQSGDKSMMKCSATLRKCISFVTIDNNIRTLILFYKSVNKHNYWRTCIIIYWYNTTGWTILNWLLVKPTPSIYIGISELRLWNAEPTYISISLLTDLYNNILIQHNRMDHIKSELLVWTFTTAWNSFVFENHTSLTDNWLVLLKCCKIYCRHNWRSNWKNRRKSHVLF